MFIGRFVKNGSPIFMISKTGKLRSIAQRMIREEVSIGEAIAVARDLEAFFTELTDVGSDAGNPEDRTSTHLAGGMAIGPWQAARCVAESRRTCAFTAGTHAAIADILVRFPEGPIEIVYAGCGPYGTILVPILTLFDRRRINATFIDIHERSLESVRKVASELGLLGDNINFVRTDAATYVHPRRPHLVISETMQNALQKEMQVPISLNFGPRIEPGGAFIPEEIAVDAIFARPGAEAFSAEAEKDRIHLGEICRFDPLRPDAGAAIREPVRLSVPRSPRDGYCFALSTAIRVYGQHRLLPRASSITNFLIINQLSDLAEPREVEFRYDLGRNPGFRWRFVEDQL